jgi:hypothetical protein
MSVDELMTLLEAHPSATAVMAVTEPAASTIFMPVAVQALPGPAPRAALLLLRQVEGSPQARQNDGSES